MWSYLFVFPNNTRERWNSTDCWTVWMALNMRCGSCQTGTTCRQLLRSELSRPLDALVP